MIRSRAPRRHVHILQVACVAILAAGAVGAAGCADDLAPDEEGADQTSSALEAGEQTVFSDDVVPAQRSVADPDAVELGMKFRAATNGTVTGVRFYKGAGNRGPHRGSLWSASGARLASVTFTGETRSGWQLARFASPVRIRANQTYVVSYHAPVGSYAGDNGGMSRARSRGALTGLADGADGPNGVYVYGASAFPRSSFRSSNYYVDVVFRPDPPTGGGETLDAGAPPPPPPPPTPPTGRKGWQLTRSNVGLAGVGLSCDALPLYSGPSKVPAGTVLRGQRIEQWLDLSAGGIVVERSCIRPNSAGRGMPVVTTTDFNRCTSSGCAVAPTLVTLRDVDIDGSRLTTESAAFATGFVGIATIQRAYIHRFGGGIALMGTGRQISATIEETYVTQLVAWGNPATTGNHSDAFTVRDFDASVTPGRQLVIRNNRFDCNSGNDTGALFVQTYGGNIHNVLVEGNLLEGAGWQLGLNQTGGNGYSALRALDNRFSGTGFGAAYVQGGPGWADWRDNHINDPAAANNKGRVVSRP